MSRKRPSSPPTPPRRAPPGNAEAEEEDYDSGGLVRTSTAWLEDSSAPPRIRDRSHSLEVAAAAATGASSATTDANLLTSVGPGTGEGVDPVSGVVGPGRGQGAPDIKFESPPRSVRDATALDRLGSSPTMGLRLDVDPAPVVKPGINLADPSPHAPGDMDELTRFGSSVRDVGRFDLFASTGTSAYAGASERGPRDEEVFDAMMKTRPPRKVVPETEDDNPEAGGDSHFQTILKGSSRKGLPYGATTPLPPGATGALKPGKKPKGNFGRFENQLVPESFPGRRTGTRDDEDIGSSEEGEAVQGWRRLLPGFLRKGGSRPEDVPEPSVRTPELRPRSAIGPSPAFRTSGTPDSKPLESKRKISLGRVVANLKGPVSSWNLGTSVYFSAVPLAIIRLLLLFVAIASLVGVVIKAATASESPWKALLTSSLPFTSVALVVFMAVAAVASWMHLLQPSREIRDRTLWKVSAVLFSVVLGLSVTQVLRFLALSSSSSLRSSALSGSDAVFQFGSVYSIVGYVTLLVTMVEFALNNVPVRSSYLLIPFVLSIGLVAVQIALSPSLLSAAVGAAVLLGSALANAGIAYAHSVQRKYVKTSLDKESTLEEFAKGYEANDDEDDVAYESPHASGAGSLVGSVGGSRV